MRLRLREFLCSHYIAIIAAAIVGLICVLPQIIFIISLGPAYKGIHFFATPNEDAYMAIIQEVLDGHPAVASMPFWEYKNQLPLLPPTIAIVYASFSKLFGVSLVNTLIVSKFFLPAILFFLVYLFTRRLANDPSPCRGGGGGHVIRPGKGSFDNPTTLVPSNDGAPYVPPTSGEIFVAITAGLMVTLGFDLVDYRSIVKFISGQSAPDGFLIWTRPVNPISGAILLFIFLLAVLDFWQNKKIRWKNVLPACVSLALMMASYFFSWSLALSALGALGVAALIKKDWGFIKFSVVAAAGAMILSSPYWRMVASASRLQWYAEASARIGLWLTRAPHVNKFLLAITIWFIAISAWQRGRRAFREQWWQFCAALLLAGWVAYNQQAITGREIWYYHYVFYTIPFVYAVFLVSGYKMLRPIFPRVWTAAAVILGISSLALGSFTQSAAYARQKNHFHDFQKFAPVFEYFNGQAPKDCVVLVNETPEFVSHDIAAFTHCNTYVSGERFVVAPPERFIHNYLALLRLRGIPPSAIEQYLSLNRAEATSFIGYQLQGSLGYPDVKFEVLMKELPARYRGFLENDFRSELKKYRADYLLTFGPLDPATRRALSPLSEAFSAGDAVIYKFVDK